MTAQNKKSAQFRREFLSAIDSHNSVTELCKKYKISRKTFYKWKSIFEKENHTENRKQGRKSNVDPRIFVMIKQLIAANPTWSIDRLYKEITLANSGVQLVSRKWIQYQLQKNKLSTVEKRRVFSYEQNPPVLTTQLQQSPATDVQVSIPEQQIFVAGNTSPPRFIVYKESIYNKIYQTYATISPIISPYISDSTKEILKEATAIITANKLATMATIVLAIANAYLVGQVGNAIIEAEGIGQKVGMLFSSLALFCGTFFFIYSLKYYITVAMVIIRSRTTSQKNSKENSGSSRGKFTTLLMNQLAKVGSYIEAPHTNPVELQKQVVKEELTDLPFFSVQIPLYNEKKVANRVVAAAVAMDYPNFEVIVCDDSTDETTQLLREKWGNHPKVTILHRDVRKGYKGAALHNALSYMNAKTDYVVVFDADFVPYPDTLNLFAKYFSVIARNERNKSIGQGSISAKEVLNSYSNDIKNAIFTSQNSAADYYNKTVALQGYQWHVLNKSENWITRAVRSEFAGSYIVERSGTQLFSLLKQIAGSVYAINATVLKEVGWGTSITEDFQLTLKLYEQGYKVAYTPYIQAPSECVSTLKRLIRQRQRWAEGHSHNMKLRLHALLSSKNMTTKEKWETVYLAPYYLQSFIFIIGTIAWIVAEVILKVKLPFWTSALGWSLVLTNLFSLPLMNTIGLFLEEGEERDYLGIFSFVTLCYILAPFIGWAALKGYIEKEEGPWFRTPKSGRITDKVERTNKTQSRIGKFAPWVKPTLDIIRKNIPSVELPGSAKYLAYTTAGNTFNNTAWVIRSSKLKKRVVHTIILFLTGLTALTNVLQTTVPQAFANPDTYYARSDYADNATRSGTAERVQGSTADNWYNASWSYRKKLTINESQISGSSDLIEFPILVSITDADLAADAQDDGDDILFTLGDKTTKLAHEIESFNGTTGELTAWVKIPSLSATANTNIYLYYGNGSASSQQNVASVWEEYIGVWHLKETPDSNSGTTEISDSTGINNGTAEGSMDGTDVVTGKIGNALDFDGGNDRISAGTASVLNLERTNEITLQAWFKTTSNGSGSIVAKMDNNTSDRGYQIQTGGSGKVFGQVVNTYSSNGVEKSSTSDSNYYNGAWHHVVSTYNGNSTAAGLNIYFDGSLHTVSTGFDNLSATILNNVPLTIGSRSGSSAQYYTGQIDEVRLSNKVRSADWIATEYNNQNSPGTFHTVGSEEARTTSTGQDPQTMTMDGTNTTFYMLTDNVNKVWSNDMQLNDSSTIGERRNVQIATHTDGSTVAVWEDSRNNSSMYTNNFSTSTNNMATARMNNGVTALQSGGVLVSGGITGTATFTSSAEVYDPISNTFTLTSGNMKNLRADHETVLLDSGRVLLAGGRSATNTVVSSAELYSPYDQTAATMFTATTGNMITRRTDFSLTKLGNGKVLSIGGCNTYSAGVCSARSSSAEIYDPATNTWTLTGSLVSGVRQYPSSISLNDGRVLTVGGFDGTNRLSTSEIYDPTTGTWQRAAPISEAKERVGIALLSNGRVIIVGGHNGTSNLSTTELYDPASNTWTNAGMISSDLAGGYRNNQIIGLGNSKIFAVASDNATNGTSTAQLYDPVTGTWTATGTNSGTTREGSIPTLLPSGKILITGGGSGGTLTALSTAAIYSPETYDIYTQKYDKAGTKLWNSGVDMRVNSDDGARYSSNGPALYNHLNPSVSLDTNGDAIIAWEEQRDSVYNTTIWSQKMNSSTGAKQWPIGTQGVWSAGANMPRVHVDAAYSVLQNGKIIIAGGHDGAFTGITATEIYDPVANTWSVGGNMTSLLGAYTQGTLLLNGNLLAAGGSDGQTALLYNPSTNTWTTTGSLLTYRAEVAEVITLNNGKALIAGGTDYGTAHSSAELYDPVTGTWSYTSGGMRSARYRARYVKLPLGNVLAVGGCTSYSSCSTSPTSTAELYNPVTNTWTNAGNMSTARSEMSTNVLANGKVLVVGGSISGGSNTSTAEIYDPATNTWSFVASAPNVISESTVRLGTTLTNGKVLVTGGYNGSYAYLYDPSANTWTATGSLSAGKVNPSMGVLNNGEIFLAGGQNTSFSGGYSALELFNVPGTDKKVSSENAFMPTFGTAVFFKKPKVAIDSSNNAVILWQDNEGTKPTVVTRAFNYDANTYRQIGVNPQNFGQTQNGAGGGASVPQLSPAVQIRGQKICGNASGCDAGTTSGERQWGDSQANINKNNPQDLILSSVRNGQNVNLVNDGTNFVLTYESDSGTVGTTTKTPKIYSQKIDSSGNTSWSSGFAAPSGGLVVNRRTNTTTMLNDGKVLIAAGQNSGVLSSGEVYNPLTRTSTAATNNMNVRRISHSATLLENGRVIIVGGGTSATTGSSTANLFTPSGNSGTFSTGPNLRLGTRADHTANLLRTGQVLITAGRSGAATTQLSTSELYNPVANTFTATTGHLRSDRRYNHKSTILADGKVLVSGGTNGTGPVSSAELYDPATGTWTITGTMVQKRRAFSLSLLKDGRVLAVGGCSAGGGTTCTTGVANRVSSAELYDPTTGTWTATGSLTISPRSEHTALVLPSGKVLIHGGTTDGSTDLSTSEIYDPITGTFVAGAVSTVGRKDHDMVGLASGDLLVVNGWNDTTTYSSVELYTIDQKISNGDSTYSKNPDIVKDSEGNFQIVWQAWRAEGLSSGASGGSWQIVGQKINNPASGSVTKLWPSSGNNVWTATGNLPGTRRSGDSVVLPTGKVLLTSGDSTHNDAGYLTSSVLYDPYAGTWTATGSTSQFHLYGNMAVLSNGKAMIAGGQSTGGVVSSAELYDPGTGTWTTTGNMRAARHFQSMNSLNDGRVIAAGGNTTSTVTVSTAEIYDPSTGTWTNTTGNMIASRSRHQSVKLNNGNVLVVGGCSNYGSCTSTILTTTEIFNPSTGTWSNSTGGLAQTRLYSSVTVMNNGKVLAAGGYDGTNYRSTAEIYDPIAQTWSLAANMPNTAASFDRNGSVLLSNGKVLVTGGQASSGAYLYDPTVNTWSTTGSNSKAYYYNGRLNLLKDGRVLVAGGYDFATTVYSSSEVYTPELSEKLVSTPDEGRNFNNTNPKIASDSASGVSYVAWESDRAVSGSDTTIDTNIYMQKLTSAGNPVWPNGLGQNGSYNVRDVIVNNSRGTIGNGTQTGVSVAKRIFQDGSAYPLQLAWTDSKNSSPALSIYGQSYDTINRSMTSTSWTAYFIVNGWASTDALEVQVGATEANGESQSFESTVGSLTAAGSPGDGEKSIVFSNMPPTGEESLTHKRLIMKITRTAGSYTLRYNGPNDANSSIDADTRLDVGIVVPERTALLGLIIPFLPMIVMGYKRKFRRSKIEKINKKP